MTEARVQVKSPVGLHARPAALFVAEAMKHACRVEVLSRSKKANGKSILQVLALGVQCGQEIVIRADGAGEGEAVAALVGLMESQV